MKTGIVGLLVCIAAMTMLGCALTYRSASYDEQLWALARAHGYEEAFHTHIGGYGMCAVVLVSGTGGNRFSAEMNAYRRGQKFFNPSIGNVPIFGDVIIEERKVIMFKEKVFKTRRGGWRAESIVISPLSPY